MFRLNYTSQENVLLPTESLKAKDHASVQISIAKVDEDGRAIAGENITYALSGYVRGRGEADDSLNRLAQQDGLLKNVWSTLVKRIEE